MRTNFAEMPGKFERRPRAASTIFKGDAVVRVSRLEEEAIEIGNSYRTR
jgi:hypothetical protein